MENNVERVQTGGAMARPDFLKRGDVRGRENITKEDLLMPRLAIAQAMSPELKPTEPKRIQGLQQGELFNTLTRAILGQGPLFFTVISAEKPRGIEFYPRDEGGGVKDMNVPLDDPRMQFGAKGELPVATKFYDFIVMMLDPNDGGPVNKEDISQSLIALSFKSTGIKVARALNTLMQYRDAPSFAGRYELTVVPERNQKGEYFNFAVRNAGWVSEETFNIASQAYEALKTKNVKVDYDESSEGDASFDTSAYDGPGGKM